MRSYLFILFVLVCPLAFAQPGNLLPEVEQKMQALNWLVGKWQGNMYITLQDGNKHEYKQTLEFAGKLKNSVLLIDESAVRGQDTLFQNIGLLGYNAAQSKYSLQAYTKDGSLLNAEVEMQDKKMIWRMQASGYVVRYTARLNDKGQWYQTGEISTDGGKQWNSFFESTLTRSQ